MQTSQFSQFGMQDAMHSLPIKQMSQMLKTQGQLDPQPVAFESEHGIVLSTSGLSKSFGGMSVLNEVDVELKKGQFVLLEGENGAGKTLLINLLTGNLKPDAGIISYFTPESVSKFRFPLSFTQNANPFGRFAPDTIARLGVVRTWQDVRLFPSMTLRENVCAAISESRRENPIFGLLGLGGNEKKELEAAELLDDLGLAGRGDSFGDMISLGQSKRVEIARAVMAGAKVLFLDEPLAGLDREGIADVLRLLEKLVNEHELTVVVVEHVFNKRHLRHLITERWLLENGRLLINPSLNGGEDKGEGKQIGHSWISTFENRADNVVTEKLQRGAVLTRFQINGRYDQSKPVLELNNLSIRRGRRTVIGLSDSGDEDGLNLVLHAGEIAVLQAPNGWGKTTLLEYINGAKQVIPHPRYLPAKDSLFLGLSVEENLELGRARYTAVDEGNKTAGKLSGGQRRMLAIKIFTVVDPALCLMMLDEPFNALDTAHVQTSINLILDNNPNPAILIVEPERI